MDYANRVDRATAGRYEAREADWRNGAIVYQVLVDRFAPSADLAAKHAHYGAPRKLRAWTDEPRRGPFLPSEKLWRHELEFWGGDLVSTMSRLDHVQQLGADVLYLNPIVEAATNHKYDALDYQQVAPEYGTRDDLRRLAAELKRRGMKLVLDGVFNHMGRQSAAFRAALAEQQGETGEARTGFKEWFFFGPQYPGGARGWWNAQNLPELNLENPAVRAHLWEGQDSVVRRWLRDGADGWRLDVGFDIGFRYLEDLTRAAQAEKPGALVVGEIPNYPSEWFPSVDGVLHFGWRRLLISLANQTLDAQSFQRMLTRLLRDADYEHLLKSWVYLDNHDTPRIATAIPDARARRVAQVLQFTLPGSVNLYYGSEVAMEGGDDPEMRGPMRWDRVTAQHPELGWIERLAALRRSHRALRVGDFRSAEASGNIVAFERHTDRVADTVLVLVNPNPVAVATTVMVTNSKLMDGDHLVDLLSGQVQSLQAGLIQAELPATTAWVLAPRLVTAGGYSNFKRVQ